MRWSCYMALVKEFSTVETAWHGSDEDKAEPNVILCSAKRKARKVSAWRWSGAQRHGMAWLKALRVMEVVGVMVAR